MDKFDFAGNADFQAYLKRVDLDATSLDKVKQKWFQKTFPAASTSSSSSPSSSSSSAPRPSAPPASSRSAPSSSAPPSGGRVDAIVGLQAASLVLSVLFLGSVVVPALSGALRLAFLAQVALWLLVLRRQVGGQFALSAEFAAQCFQRDAAHYAVYSLLFWGVADSLLPLLPLLVYSFFNCITVLAPLHPLLARLTSLSHPHRERALSMAVQLEVLLLPLLVVFVFMGGSLLAVFGHYNFLKFRYMFSATTRAVVDYYVGIVDSKIVAVPFVSKYYFMVRNWLAQAPANRR